MPEQARSEDLRREGQVPWPARAAAAATNASAFPGVRAPKISVDDSGDQASGAPSGVRSSPTPAGPSYTTTSWDSRAGEVVDMGASSKYVSEVRRGRSRLVTILRREDATGVSAALLHFADACCTANVAARGRSPARRDHPAAADDLALTDLTWALLAGKSGGLSAPSG
jgi:hypothetical protein